ncbi:MAG: ATP-dependent zinc metalloprotease FtsH, partial [Acidimicrobiales bacterium]
IAYHEAGHAVAAAVLPHADPVHKVTILPMGMALGVTQQLPVDEKHIYRQDYIEDSLVVRMGGRIAEDLVFGVISTGANNDLVGSTELARKMVREWGMSKRVGPMAWGSQGAVFLGDDLMHTRDYSDETARVIDEEVERILREQEERCRQVLTKQRKGLDLVARALLEHETIDGAEVDRLVELGQQGRTAVEEFGEWHVADGRGEGSGAFAGEAAVAHAANGPTTKARKSR